MTSPRLTAYIEFRCRSDLDETGAILSEHLLGGLKFRPEPGLRDEVDGLVLEKEILGLAIALYGSFCQDRNEYELRLELFPGKQRFDGRMGPTQPIGASIAPLIDKLDGFSVTGVFPA